MGMFVQPVGEEDLNGFMEETDLEDFEGLSLSSQAEETAWLARDRCKEKPYDGGS